MDIYNLLAKAGYTKAIIYYSGRDDDGSVSDLRVADAQGREKKLAYPWYKDPFASKLEQHAYDTLDDARVGDWVNNAGGYGTIIIDTIARKTAVDHYENVIETRHSNFEV